MAKRKLPAFLIISGILVLLFGALIIWRGTVNATPQITIPKHILPANNAYDTYIQASSLLVKEDDIRRAPIIHPAPEEHIYAPTEKEALVKLNAPALSLTRKALAQDEYCCPVREDLGFYSDMDRIRNLGYLLVLEGQVMANRNDWNNAMDCFLDAFEMGRVVPRAGGTSGWVYGQAIQSVAAPNIWQAVNHLSAAQSRAAVHCMEKIEAKRVPLADTIREDKWIALRYYQQLFKTSNWRGQFLSDACDFGKTRNEFSLTYVLATSEPDILLGVMGCSKQKVITDLDRIIDQWVEYTSKPYAAKGTKIPSTSNPFVLLRSYDGYFFEETKSRVMDSLLTITLALRAYKLEHGSYPNKIDELVPSYIKRMPDDLLVLLAQIKYRKIKNSYILYSIGPDGKDDGGRACVDTKTSAAKWRYYVDWNSKGDIVAGVNN